jgi:hypothetical protein
MTKITNSMKEKAISMKKNGKRIQDIAKKLGISDRTINKHSSHFPHPKKKTQIPLPKSAIELTKEKAEIIGYICAEGNDNDNTGKYKEYDLRRRKFYNRDYIKKEINFSNMDKTIQERFIHLMSIVYDYPLKVYKRGSVYIKRKAVVEDLRKYTLFGSKRWNVPKELFEKKYYECAKKFIRGYADGDGSVDTTKKTVVFDSTNRVGLTQVGNLLEHLEIKFRYNEYNQRFRIVINEIELFQNKIGFFHPGKKEKLESIIKKKAPRTGISTRSC